MVKKKRRSDRVTDLDIVTAIHRSRSQKAQDVDDGTFARVTTSAIAWSFQKNRLDFSGVDTPNVKRRPKNLNEKRALSEAKKRGFFLG